MSGFSPKVTSASVAAGIVSTVGGIVGPHVFPHGTPSDVKGLALGAVSAGLTFASGFLAKHHIDAAKVAEDGVSLADDLGLPFTQIPEWIEPQVDPAPVAQAVPVVAPVAPAAVAPVAVAAPVGLPAVPAVVTASLPVAE